MTSNGIMSNADGTIPAAVTLIHCLWSSPASAQETTIPLPSATQGRPWELKARPMKLCLQEAPLQSKKKLPSPGLMPSEAQLA